MNRCMVFAATLFDPHRTPPALWVHPDGTLDESGHITPGQVARVERERADLVAILNRMRGRA